MTFQVADVSKALGSASNILRHGNSIVMDMTEDGKDLAYIQNKKTGQQMWMRQRNGVYVLDLLVAPPSDTEDPKGQNSTQQLANMGRGRRERSSWDFGRQGSRR